MEHELTRDELINILSMADAGSKYKLKLSVEPETILPMYLAEVKIRYHMIPNDESQK